MTLSCSCADELEPGYTYYDEPGDFAELKTKIRQRCWSCNALINTGSIVLEFHRFKIPDSDIEIRIYGEEGGIPRASRYICERCGDIYASLSELGFCVYAWEHQGNLLEDYQNMYGRGQVLPEFLENK